MAEAEYVSLLVSRKVHDLRLETDELVRQLERDQDPDELVQIQDLIGVNTTGLQAGPSLSGLAAKPSITNEPELTTVPCARRSFSSK